MARLLVPARADWVLLDLLSTSGDSFQRIAVAHARPDARDVASAMKRVYPLASGAGRGIEAAIRERATQLLHDLDDVALRGIARDPAHLEILRAMAPRSSVAAPLIAHGDVIGALTVVACDRNYGDVDARFVEQYALAAAAVIENARLIRDRQRARARVERRQAVIEALSRARTAADVAAAACQAGAQATEAYSGAMWLSRDDGGLELAGHWGTPEAFIEQFRSIPADADAPALHVARTGEPLWIESDAAYAAASPSIYGRVKEAGRVASFGVVPLRVGARTFGVITFAHRPGRTYPPDERADHVLLAHHCAQALERALLSDEIQRAATQFQLAIEAAATAMVMVDRHGTVTLANAQVERVFGYRRDELIGRPLEALLPVSPLASSDSRRDLRGVRKDGTALCLEIGVTPIETTGGPGLLASIVDVSERVAQRQRIELLQGATAALSRAASAHDVVTAIVDQGTACVGSLQGGVWLVSPDRRFLELTYGHGYNEPIRAMFARVPLEHATPITQAVRTRSSIWIESRARFREVFATTEAASRGLSFDEVAFFAVPLLIRDECVGVMSFNWAHPREFDEAERGFVEALADLAARALERAQATDAE